jgi:hypothetical protein
VRDGSLSNTRKKEEFFTLATSKLFYMRTNPEEDYILAGETAGGFGSKAGWKRERGKRNALLELDRWFYFISTACERKLALTQ